MKLIAPVCLAAAICCGSAVADSLTIDSVAGTGAPENNGGAGPARSINVGDPFGVEVGPDDALYVTEIRNHRVLRVDLSTLELTTVAGCGRRGYSGDGGLATKAELNEPYEVRFDSAGNMFFVEMQNHIVRRVDVNTKIISTVAGTGKRGFGGDDGPAVNAQLNQPHSIALDADGAIYIADIGNHRIRRIDPATGIIQSIAGNGNRRLPLGDQIARGNPIVGPRALYIHDNILWIALREGHSIWRMDLGDGVLRHVSGTGKAGFSGDVGPAALATFNGPKGIALGPDGTLVVADTENHAIRTINLNAGTISTIAGNGPDSAGGDGDGGAAAKAALNRPHGVCVGLDGTVYVGDTLNHRVRRIQAARP